MATVTTNDNEVLFLMDGAAFFTELHNQFQAIAGVARGTANTYVRLAYWAADPGCRMNDPARGGLAITLWDDIRQVVRADHRVDLILWEPDMAGKIMMHNMASGAAWSQTASQNWNLHDGYATGTGGKFRVYREPYNGWIVGTSNHQKIAIFSNNGVRTILVGGINLADWYWDNQAHAGNPVYVNSGQNGTIHDTAVRLRGPCTDAIEAEWIRRWRKSGYGDLANNTTAQLNYPIVGGATVQVTVAFTNSESTFSRLTDIKETYETRITAANNYIYMENYAFVDPSLVKAVRRRIKTAVTAGVAPPRVILMIPHPRARRAGPIGRGVYDFLHRSSFAKVNHPDCTNIQWPTLSGGGLPIGVTTVNRAAQQLWDVGDNWEIGSTFRSLANTVYNRFFENDYFEWNSSRNSRWLGNYNSRRITDIDTMALPGSGRMFSPVRRTLGNNWLPIYIHSKLALFDDQWLALGTANFTYRSMNYDGEIAVFVNNPTIATNARTALFNHWQTGAVAAPIPATFDARANAAAGHFAGNTATAGTYVVPLALGDFWNRLPTGGEGWMNYTFY